MKLEEMKLAVCEKLPEVVKIKYHLVRGGGSVFYPHFYWFIKNRADEFYRDTINWPTEGLQVCNEAEKLLTDDEWQHYFDLCVEAVAMSRTNPRHSMYPRTLGAPYEQRLEALCRVWWPEKFSK